MNAPTAIPPACAECGREFRPTDPRIHDEQPNQPARWIGTCCFLTNISLSTDPTKITSTLNPFYTTPSPQATSP